MNSAKPYIFISHSKKDESALNVIVNGLRVANYDAWIDVDDIPDGSSWMREIEKAVLGCGAMIVILTKNALESEWVERETLVALNARKPVFIALFDDSTLPIHLVNRQYTDFRKRPDAALKRLINALGKVSLTAPLPTPVSSIAQKRISANPNEHNFFKYIEQLPDGAVCARVARDLYQWGDANADDMSFTGRAAPACHANVYVGPGGATVFSIRAHKRQPTVEVPLGRLAEFAPFDQRAERLRVLNALNRLLPDSDKLGDERADKLPNLPLAKTLGTDAALDAFKRILQGIIDDLRKHDGSSSPDVT